MTQKELAAALHVSDRAVSKWERGAGFPDISLLEPLADALGLGVLDLLRGERGTEPEPELTVRQALALLARQAKERTRRRWSQVLASIALLCLVGVFLPALIYSMGFSWRPVNLDVPVKVYVDGKECGAYRRRVPSPAGKDIQGNVFHRVCRGHLPGRCHRPYLLECAW